MTEQTAQKRETRQTRGELRRSSVAAVAAGCLALALSIAPGGPAGVASASASVTEFGAKGTGAGQFEEPHGIAVFQETGVVYLNDTTNARVDSFGPEGAFRFALGWGVLDGKNELEVCSTVCQAGIPGAGAGQFGSFEPNGLAVDNSPESKSYGDLYVVETSTNRVQKFDAKGNFLLTFGKGVNLSTKANVCSSAESNNCGAGEPSLEPGAFDKPRGGVGVDAAGIVYVGDLGRVDKFTAAGAFVSQFPVGEGANAEGANAVLSLAVSKSNVVFTISQGIAGIHRYDSFGAELGLPFDVSVQVPVGGRGGAA